MGERHPDARARRRRRVLLPRPNDSSHHRPRPRAHSRLQASIYWPNQDVIGVSVDPAAIDALRQEEKAAAAAAGAAATRRRDLAAQHAALSTGMSAEDVAKATAETEARLAAGRAKLEKFTSAAAPLVKPEERAAAIATLDRYRKTWSARKGAVMEVRGARARRGGHTWVQCCGGARLPPRQLHDRACLPIGSSAAPPSHHYRPRAVEHCRQCA